MDYLQSSVSTRAMATHKWWAVAAIYDSLHPGVRLPKKLSELRVILVDAVDKEQAERVGQRLALEYETEYRNVYGESVIWKLNRVEYVVELNDRQIGHGVEVYNNWIVKNRPIGKKRKRNAVEEV